MLTALLLAAAFAPTDTVRYAVSFPDPAHHEARIVVDFPAAKGDTLEVWMSRSSPGRYALHEFAKNVYDVEATDAAGRPLQILRRDPYRWLVVARGRAVRFAYTLFADRADGTYSQVDPTHAHFNIPATFAWARRHGAQPVSVRFAPPEASGWRVAGQLLPTADPFTWTAPDLAYFMDSPTELSAHMVRSWTVPGARGRMDTIHIALHHEGTEAEADRYADAVRKVVAEQIGVFGETAQYDHHAYTFLADYLPWASGDGMEHRNSTVLSSTGNLAQNFNGLLLTASHEFFHSWNMERIRSAELEPFDFTQADPSPALWFGEGFTNYYDRLTVRRAGLSTDSVFSGQLAAIINNVALAPGRRFHSPVEMSLRAPFVDAATAIDPTSFTNTFLSYYTWGSGIALGLDLALRARPGDKTLDGYMRLLWERFGRPTKRYVIRRPYTVSDLERTLGEYAGDPGFARDFFTRYVRGRDIPDFATLLAAAGVLVRPADTASAYAGPLALTADSTGVVVGSPAVAGTPLYAAGLDTGDMLVSADGQPVSGDDDWQAMLARHAPGDSVALVYRQRGREVRSTLGLTRDPRVAVELVERAGQRPTEAQLAFRSAWLGSRAGR